MLIFQIAGSEIFKITNRGCIKSPPPPAGTSARVLLLNEEEKVNALLIFTFPSFAKEGCHARRVMTGWLKHL
jgi:hypothetical protein